MNVQFANIGMLYLLWLAPLACAAWYMVSRRREAALLRFMDPGMLARIGPRPERWRLHWQMALFLAGSLCIITALARPQWGMREEVVFQRGRDLMIALDVSRSMLARDVHPSRLARAKLDLRDLLKELRGDRVGLITFRGKAVVRCPLTTDYAFFVQSLDSADTEAAPAGPTSLGDAIRKALDAFEGDQGSHKALVLVSDGEDLAGDARRAAETAKEKGVAIFTVGLGNPDGSRIPEAGDGAFLRYQGNEVVSRLDNETLRAIAETTGGAYVPVGTANVNLGMLYRDHLSRIQAREMDESTRRRYIERFQYFLLPGLLLMLGAAFMSRGRIVTGPRPARGAPATPAATAILILLFSLPAAGQSPPPVASTNIPPGTNGAPPAIATDRAPEIPAGRAGARRAQQLYQRGRYAEAADAYRAAARQTSQTLQNQMLYNAGCALFEAGRFDEAADTFRDLLQRERADVAAAAFNRGVTLHRLAQATNTADDAWTADELRAERLRQSGESFQRALRAAPEDNSGRESLAAVVEAIPEADMRARIAGLMKRYGQVPPDALTDILLLNQRALVTRIADAYTNEIPEFIRAMEKLAADQRANADILVPLKGQLMQALASQPGAVSQSNQAALAHQAGMVERHIEALRDQCEAAASAIRDLGRDSQANAASAATAIYPLWKAVAGYQQLLREDILQQTNLNGLAVMVRTPIATNIVAGLTAQQREAAELSRLFTERFTAAVPAEGLMRQPAVPTGTNAPSTGDATNAAPLISKENRQKILDLAGKALGAQERAATLVAQGDPSLSLPDGREAYRLLKEIEKLLPRQESQQQQEQKQNQQQQDSKQEQNQDQQQKPPEQQQDQQQQPQPEPEQKKPEQPEKQEMSKEDLQRILEKARQREQDHQEELRQRQFHHPLPQVDRDW